MVESACDLNCPQYNGIGIAGNKSLCCKWCARARKYYVTEENKHLWDENDGFWSPDGCRLTRDKMPKECLEYDCKNEVWMTTDIRCSYFIWKDGKWQAFPKIEGHFINLASAVDELTDAVRNSLNHLNKEHGI